MLNRQLYDKLVQVFGNVIVENENQRPVLKLLPAPKSFGGSVREWKFDDSVRGSSGEVFRVNCPICGDRKHHCYISALSFTNPVIRGRTLATVPLLINCFRRECFKSHPERKQELTEKITEGVAISFEVKEEVSVFGGATDMFSDIHSDKDENLLIWQPDYHPITNDAPSEVLDYIDKRGIRQEDIIEMKIGYGKCWNYKKQSFIGDKNWIMFPIIDQAGLRGFQSRQIFSDNQLKYFFDSRTPKKMCLYNRERASRFNIVAIAEGIVDALHIGRCGMAFFGKEPSKAQIKLLQQDGAKMVLYIPDQKRHYTPEGVCDLDPEAIADKHIEEWNRKHLFEWGAYRIRLPKDDAGECNMTEIWTCVLEQLAAIPDFNEEILNQIYKQLEQL